MTSSKRKTEANPPGETAITSMPPAFAEPAPLGLIGLAVAALVLGLTDLEYASVSSKAGMIPWTIFLGATAQLIAGLMDFRRNNIFGGTAFTTYALLWYSVSLTLILAIYFDAKVDMAHYAHGLLGFLFFSIILTIASLMTNKTFIGILIWIDIAIYALIMQILHGTSQAAVGYALLVVSLLSFYGAAAILLNTMSGKEVLPLGKPLWKV